MNDLFPNGTTTYLQGGLLLGAGVSLIFLLCGRVAGASSFFSTTLSFWSTRTDLQQASYKASRVWRIFFALGLIVGAAIFTVFANGGATFVTQVEPWRLVVGGLLVGLGTRVSRGCTSGHGICGLSSWSLPSLIAVACFMGVAILVALATDRLGITKTLSGEPGHTTLGPTSLSVALGLLAALAWWRGRENLIVLVGGSLFGYGLALSQMAKPEVVLSFLQLQDFGLVLVMGGGVVVTMATFHIGRRILKRPAIGTFEPFSAALRPRTFVGAVVFGVGWGLSGLCPGSALASLGIGNGPVLLGLATMFLGAYVQARWFPENRVALR